MNADAPLSALFRAKIRMFMQMSAVVARAIEVYACSMRIVISLCSCGNAAAKILREMHAVIEGKKSFNPFPANAAAVL